MSETNIDQFNEVTGEVFAHLYENFPIPVLLRPELFGIEEHLEGEYDSWNGVTTGATPISKDEIIFGHTVQWLIDSGYLTSGRLPAGSMPEVRTYFDRARLTAKGLEVLNAIPENLTQREPIGQRLAEATKSGGKEILRSITTEALALGVQIAARTAGFPS